MWSIDPRRTAHLVIDMQRDFVEEGRPMEVPMARRRLPQMAELLQHSRRYQIPVIYTQHVLLDSFDVSPLETARQPLLKKVGMRHGTDGIEIVDELAPLEGEVSIVKHRFDAFHNTQLETVLNTIRGFRGVDTLIISGTLTEVCCESTARSGFMRDFKIVFASESTGALSDAAQSATEDAMGKFFGRVMTNQEIIRETSDEAMRRQEGQA
ncbi:isochorismatase family protein [Citricoccus sp. GCM10030269]|uniref:isochorismatase family protein n=1 Tax=Citricoccus sp. GCM10030269 TaxID=3273388 RepID=UPI00360D94E5